MEEILPVGTVVNVGKKDGDNVDVMIAGYCARGDNNRIYDYIGFLHPYGFIARDSVLMFDSSLITEVKNKGYEDEEFKEATIEIKRALNELKGGSKNE